METPGTNRTNASKGNTEVDRINHTNQTEVNSTINSNEIIFDVKCNELNKYCKHLNSYSQDSPENFELFKESFSSVIKRMAFQGGY